MSAHWLNLSKKTIVVRPGDSKSLVVGPSGPILVAPTPAEGRTAQAGRSGVSLVAPSFPVIVNPPPRGAWDTKGWTRENWRGGRIYQGYFQVAGPRSRRVYRYRGRIIENRGEVTPYIADPPAEIKYHPKGPCFVLEEAPWFRVHWRHPAHNVDEAILYIEEVLSECLR